MDKDIWQGITKLEDVLVQLHVEKLQLKYEIYSLAEMMGVKENLPKYLRKQQ